MRIVSLNVGQPRELAWNGKSVVTSIVKHPVEHRLRLTRDGLDGDQVAHVEIHGPPARAVYLYPSEHYPYWKERLALDELPWGALGENLTTSGLLEDEVRIGDRIRVGTAEVRVSRPRNPCAKLNVRFERADMVELFLESGWSGFLCEVVLEGEVGPGDSLEILDGDPVTVTVAEAYGAYFEPATDPELLRRAVESPALPEKWRQRFRGMLAQRVA